MSRYELLWTHRALAPVGPGGGDRDELISTSVHAASKMPSAASPVGALLFMAFEGCSLESRAGIDFRGVEVRRKTTRSPRD